MRIDLHAGGIVFPKECGGQKKYSGDGIWDTYDGGDGKEFKYNV